MTPSKPIPTGNVRLYGAIESGKQMELKNLCLQRRNATGASWCLTYVGLFGGFRKIRTVLVIYTDRNLPSVYLPH